MLHAVRSVRPARAGPQRAKARRVAGDAHQPAERLNQQVVAGQLGAAYAIPIIYVPILMITHFAAFYLLARPQPWAVRAPAGDRPHLAGH